MRPTRLVAGLAGLAAATALVTAPTTATAATVYQYAGSAGGLSITVHGGIAQSDPVLGGSALQGVSYPAETANSAAFATVPHLLSAKAIHTRGTATQSNGVSTQTMVSEIANLSFLDGLVTADALRTTAIARHGGGSDATAGAATDLVGVTVGDRKFNGQVPPNTAVSVPGVIEVVLAENQPVLHDGGITVTGSALKITLLKAFDQYGVGTVITINPTVASIVPATPEDAVQVGGYAYSAASDVAALGTSAGTGSIAYVAVPETGTDDHEIAASAERINLAPVVTAGAVESTARATSEPLTADVQHTNRLARLNLLNGLITADSVVVTARVRKLADGTIVREPSTKIVNLRLAGLPVTVPTRPNSSLKIPGLLSITVDEQVPSTTGVTVTALRVKLTTPIAGLRTGADLRIGVASSSVLS